MISKLLFLLIICNILIENNLQHFNKLKSKITNTLNHNLSEGSLMKKTILFLSVALSFMLVSSTFAQSSKYGWLAKESWSFGFGGSYIYNMTEQYNRGEDNFGGFLSIQKNLTEHVGLRLKGTFGLMSGTVNVGAAKVKVTSTNVGGNVDLVYYLSPCEPVSPYFFVGVPFLYSMFDNQQPPKDIKNNFDWGIGAGMGSEFRIGENWKLKAELGYMTYSNTMQFGVRGVQSNGILGTPMDANLLMDFGFLYYFGYGEKSNLCQMYEGVNANIDYGKIEEIIKKYATEPADVDYNRIEEIVKKHKSVAAMGEQNWVLIGVNFDFNKSSLRQESFPILYHAAEILLTHPDVSVEIQGHTDNVGSDSYNKKLSLARANSVKDFLVSKGVAASRITTVGMGESNPISDNKTNDGRMLNRRIEFKVK